MRLVRLVAGAAVAYGALSLPPTPPAGAELSAAPEATPSITTTTSAVLDEGAELRAGRPIYVPDRRADAGL